MQRVIHSTHGGEFSNQQNSKHTVLSNKKLKEAKIWFPSAPLIYFGWSFLKIKLKQKILFTFIFHLLSFFFFSFLIVLYLPRQNAYFSCNKIVSVYKLVKTKVSFCYFIFFFRISGNIMINKLAYPNRVQGVFLKQNVLFCTHFVD